VEIFDIRGVSGGRRRGVGTGLYGILHHARTCPVRSASNVVPQSVRGVNAHTVLVPEEAAVVGLPARPKPVG
jgi:hypothetical protein